MNAFLIGTPLVKLLNFSKYLGADLWIKRDDLYPLHYGGNKARKIEFIIRDAITANCNAIVTAGSPFSNHARVCGLKAAQLKWNCSIVIHPNDTEAQPPDTGNLKLMRLAGATIIPCPKKDAAAAMDMEMKRMKSAGLKPFYIYGGGHCVAGSLTYYEAARELSYQFNEMKYNGPSYIFVASGMGSTQAGLHLGASAFFNQCQVTGISIARQAERGRKIIGESVHELKQLLGITDHKRKEVVFTDEFIGGGYAKRIPEVDQIIKIMMGMEAIALDPIYSGKAFFGLLKLLDDRKIDKNSRLVFWHTGGLINLLSVKL